MEITIVASKMTKEDVARKEAELRKEVEKMQPDEPMNFIARNNGGNKAGLSSSYTILLNSNIKGAIFIIVPFMFMVFIF